MFWGITLRTYAIVAEATQRRLIDEHNGRMSLAWHIAALRSQKKLPRSPSALFAKYPRTRPQTLDEQRHILRMIANTFKDRPSG